MASAVTLTAPAGTKLKAGAPLTATSSNLVFTGSSGLKLECASSHFAGEVETNGSPTSTSKINSASFSGAGGGACATNNPELTAHITALFTTTPVPTPWVLHFSTADNWALTHPEFTATITKSGVSVAHCTFTATEVTGTYTTTPNQLVFTVGTGNFVRIEPGVATCPDATGTLAGSAATTSGANVVTAD